MKKLFQSIARFFEWIAEGQKMHYGGREIDDVHGASRQIDNRDMINQVHHANSARGIGSNLGQPAEGGTAAHGDHC